MGILEGTGLAVPSEEPDGRAPLPGPVDITLAPGEGLAVTGPSGSGKSTLLRVLAILEPNAHGEVRLDGSPIPPAAIPTYRSRVQYLPQSPVRLPGSLLDNLKAPFRLAANRAAKWDEARARKLAQQLGLAAAVLERDASELSGGEAQRMALVRALLLDPRILLLDEPTASLDDDARAAAEQAIEAWRQADAQRALVLVSHDAAQLARMTSRALAILRPATQATGAAP